MSASRLTLAAEAGLFNPSVGRILAFRPPGDADLGVLSRDQTQIVHGLRHLYDAFGAQGWSVATRPEGVFDAAIVFLPREKQRAHAMIAAAAEATRGPLLIDGAKTDGIEGVLRDLRKRALVETVISKGHGKIFAVSDGSFEDWRAEPQTVDGFAIAPGLFSVDGPDRGSVALASVLPALSGRVADLGAGWGYLSSHALTSPKVTELHAVEVEHDAQACLKVNLGDERVRLHWADARTWHPAERMDAVVMNPPFHEGRRPDLSLGRAFIAAAGAVLNPRGSLWMVANRHLAYEDVLDRTFRNVEKIEGDSGFKLIHARNPIAAMRRG